MIPRQEALLLVGLLLLAGLAATVVRLLRARKHGVSIRMQVFLVLAATTLLLTVVFAAIVVDRFTARTVTFAHRAALENAELLARLTTRMMAAGDRSFEDSVSMLRASPVLAGFSDGPTETRIQLLGRDGRVLFDSRGPAADTAALSGRPEVGAALAGRTDRVARTLAGNRVAAAAPIALGGRVVGVARVTKSSVAMRDVLADTAPKVALLALILGGAAALSGIAIGRALGRPIERLTRAAERVAAGERQAALPAPSGREVRALTAAFEAMRRELESRDAILSFATDLSHELKNPVASIRAAAEVLEDAALHDAHAAATFARRIGQSAERLDLLIRDLLSLARLEARGIAEAGARLDLRQVAEGAIAELEDKAAARGIRVCPPAAAPMSLLGDAVWLRRAVGNLIANAIEHSPPDGLVTVTLQPAGRRVELLVADRGPGIDAGIAGRVFERFTSTRHGDGGSGLGLAIVRAVAEAHGGRAEIRATGPDGTTLAMILPRR